MRWLARFAGVVVAGALLAVLVEVFRPESRATEAALLVVSLAIGGAASERMLEWWRRS